ncbi:MAG: SAM-dependent methyltransferase [Sporomusaceae bacterium]|jgi:tRNA-Thr(GGU) m(6)t(6)A37 methyltransferase TsaA|nr:SAM-dependent methyltransferase [Sporomusaceae bacterium]
MEKFSLQAIGRVKVEGENVCIALAKRYAPALKGLAGFSHINVVWWFSECDNEEDRNSLAENSPYKGAPAVMGTFATRSPKRANPLALSCAEVIYIDYENAVIGLSYLDANDGTPVLDIKPYTPSLDRVENPSVPKWCGHWPQSLEQSADFDWESQFDF